MYPGSRLRQATSFILAKTLWESRW